MGNYIQSIFNLPLTLCGDRYLYNTKTNALLKLEKYEYDFSEKELEENEKEILIENGFLVKKGLNEVNDLIELINNNVMENEDKSFDITIQLTEACNFKCKYCYQSKNCCVFNEDQFDLLKSELEKIFKSEIEIINVHYFGGEPLLNANMLYKIDDYMKQLSHQYSKKYNSYITTNASLLTPHIIKKVNFNAIKLTFDGDHYWHNKLKISSIDSYKNNLDIIEKILSNSTSKVIIRFNICNENKSSFYSVIDDITRINGFDIDRIQFDFAQLKKFGTENLTADFTPLTSEEFSKIDYSLCKKLQKQGYKMFLPSAIAEPCLFTTNKAVCINSKCKPVYCTSCDKNKEDIFKFKEYYEKSKHYEHKLPEECYKCKILPLCIHACQFLQPDKYNCSVLKYQLANILEDYLENPSEWKKRD